MRKLVNIGVVVVALAAASVGGLSGGARAVGGDTSYYADVDGQYATIEGSVGNAFFGNLFSGQITLGELQASLNSQGVRTLNGFAAPAGTKSGARGDLANVGAGPIKVQTDHILATAPVGDGLVTKSYLPLHLSPVIAAGVPNGDASATWGNAVFGRAAKGRVVSTVNGDTAYIRLLDLSDSLGAFGSLLPRQLQHPVIELETLRAHGQTATVRNSDGSHGLSAGGIGGLAALQIFGGAANGGITLGLFNHDTGGKKDTAGSRVWATGKPGGAGCSYVVPDTVQVAVGNSSVGLPISVGQRITIPGGLGYLDVRFTGQSHCEKSADGTYARATGAGVGISLHLTLPSVAGFKGGDLGTLTLTLPDLDSASVKVPKGGIPPSDGPGGDTNGGGGDGGSGTGGDGTNGDAPGSGTNAADAPEDTISAVDSGTASSLPDTGGFPVWVIPLGAGLLVAGVIALSKARRQIAALD